MGLVDVHSHLEWPSFNDVLDDVILRSKENGIDAIVTSSINLKGAKRVLQIAEKFKNYVFCTLGYSPSEILSKHDLFDKYLDFAEQNSNKFIGLGEVGLDFKWVIDKEDRKFSEKCFIKAIGLADKINKPIVIHCRDAEKKTIDILEQYASTDRIHMHCYSGPSVHIKRCIKNGWFFSIPTSVIDRKSHQKVAMEVPLERMMLETDAPFLSPLKKDKRNEPKNIVLSAEFIAKLKNKSFEEVAEITTRNAKEFYKLNL